MLSSSPRPALPDPTRLQLALSGTAARLLATLAARIVAHVDLPHWRVPAALAGRIVAANFLSGIVPWAADTWRRGSDENRSEFGLQGTFREVQPAAKIVHTKAFDPGTVGGEYPGAEAIVTITFAEENGVTTVTMLIGYESKGARDAAMSTGMTDGMEYSYQQLDRRVDEQRRAWHLQPKKG